MKVYTKKGDKGTTQLIGGARVSKAELQIEAYGTVDELNAHVGLLRDHLDRFPEKQQQLIEIQNKLFDLGALLAVSEEGTKMQLPVVEERHVNHLELWMDVMDQELAPMKQFVLPGGHVVASVCHVARTVCRRAERGAVRQAELMEVHELSIKYLNRLSDYLFVLSRWLVKELKVNEVPWSPEL